MSYKKPHMIDIKTMSTASDALVLSIGCVPFDTIANTGGRPWIPAYNEKLLLVLDFNEQLLAGRRIDPDTQKWWGAKERNAARAHWMHPLRSISIRTAYAELHDHLADATQIWARGPQFDCVILETLFGSVGLPVPWKYNNVRDSRTALDLAKDRINSDIVSDEWIPHHPVHDCEREITAMYHHGVHVG